MTRSALSICIAILFLLMPLETLALEVPRLQGRVNDYADMLSPSTEQQLDAALKEFERTDSTQIVVLTIASLEGESLEEFSIKVAEKWKIGQKGLDNGAILLISKNDRKLRIEVGYGLEGKMTDLMAGRIIRDVITPYFRSGQYDQGVIEGVQAMIRLTRGEFQSSPQAHSGKGGPDYRGFLSMSLVFLFLINVLARVRRSLGALAGGLLFPIIASGFFHLGWTWALLSIPIGILVGLFLSLFGGPTSFGHRRGRGGGMWMGGFGGGGGFGGFSGGGGGFGGGGASGRW